MGGKIKRESIHRDPALPLKVIYLHPYKRHKHPLCQYRFNKHKNTEFISLWNSEQQIRNV